MDVLQIREQELLARAAHLEQRAGKVMLHADQVLNHQQDSPPVQNQAPSPSLPTTSENRDRRNQRSPRAPKSPAATHTSLPLASPRASPPPSATRAMSPRLPLHGVHGSNASPAGDNTTPTTGLGTEATVRYQRARITVLQEEVTRAQEEATISHTEAEEAEANATKAIAKAQKFERKLQGTVDTTEKLRKEVKETTLRAENAEREIIKLRRELKEVQRDAKRKDVTGNSNNVRLNRAQEQIETLKSKLKEANAGGREDTEALRKQNEKMVLEVRRLERQRNELLAAFRKQLKLVDVLKRQKLHIESAKLLSYTEAEFSKTLELGVNQ